MLRLFAEPTGESHVGAHQLSNVRWSVVFDDLELTAADITRLATEAKPLVQARGRWVELDRVDLKEAAAALADRARMTTLSGAEILRHGLGLEASPFGRVSVAGTGWATELFEKAQTAPDAPTTRPEGFAGELRSYQAEALSWLGFLDAVELGGCLALDMGLGKTPTVLAHIARTDRPRARARDRPACRRRQLGRRGGALHAPAAGGRPPRRLPGDGRRAGVGRGRRRRRHHDVRHRGPRRGGAGRAPVGPDRPRRGPGHQEPGQRDRPTAAPAPRPHPGRAHRHPDRERPRRPVGAPRLHQPGAGRHPSRLHGPDGRARARPRCGPSTASSSSGGRRASRRSPPSSPTASTSSTTAP